jgi:leucyl aminopeptidase
LIPAAENMPGDNAFLLGEILEYPNGLSVEIGNTDSEGRLVLADALIFAQTIGAERIVDMATLTYSCTGAIGSQYAGIWGDDELVKEIAAGADPVGEKVWQLPLATEYESYLNSHCADICNVSSVGEAGAITAALFLKKFVEDSNVQWAHLDMAGLKDCSSTKGYLVPGATGFGARLLAEWITRQ